MNRFEAPKSVPCSRKVGHGHDEDRARLPTMPEIDERIDGPATRSAVINATADKSGQEQSGNEIAHTGFVGNA